MLSFLMVLVLSSMMILLMCAFYTLFERHFLSHMQIRRGPKKVGSNGLLQPIVDGVKLFSKNLEINWIKSSKFSMYFIGPILAFLLMLILWSGCLKGSKFSLFSCKVGMLLFLCMSGLKVYPLILSGWASNSKYAFMGAIRGGAQTISFEISLLFLVMCPCFYLYSYSVLEFNGKSVPLGFVWFPMFLMWIPLVVAESNRAPFDFAEGESELVSGFNMEFGGMFFSLLFLGEYGAILAFSWFSGMVFGGGLGLFISMFFVVTYMLLRGLLPRYRVDLLVGVFWRFLMPVGLLMLVGSFFI